MHRAHSKNLLTDPIVPTLTRMTIPPIFGIVAILLFNLVDTYFIGLMGPQQLAAISFTFPVSMVLMHISMGIGIGTAIHVSSRIGRGDLEEARKTAAHALLLGISIAIPLGIIGNLTITPLFSLLGADEHTTGYIREYMSWIYAGYFLLIIPMVGNSVMRATGDTKTPSIIMAGCGLTNGILDPLLIFGIGPFPELGIPGAAIATIFSWGVGAVMVITVLLRRTLMTASDLSGRKRERWRSILNLAIPATTTNLMMPLSAAIITAMAASYGAAAVTGFGVGTRIEAVALVAIIALSSAVTPFVGQNFGAGNNQRIRETLIIILSFAMIWGALMAGFLYLGNQTLAELFTSDPAHKQAIGWYLCLVPISYGFQGMVILICSSLNAMHRPYYATTISITRLFALTIPLAWAGSQLYGIKGLFGGMAVANCLIAIAALIWLWNRLPKLSQTP